MKKIILIITALFTCFFSAYSYTIELVAGRLNRHIAAIEKELPEEIVITGEMDVRDFAVLTSLPPSVKSLNLSEVMIRPYSYSNSKYMGRKDFKEGEVPPYSFFGLGITDLLLPSSAKEISEGALSNTFISNLVLPDGIVSLGDYAFYQAPNLQGIEIPSSVKSVGKHAFAKCTSLTSASLKDASLEEFPEGLFEGCVSLSDLSLPKNLKILGKEALAQTAIESLDLSTVTVAEAFSLSQMPALREVVFNSGSLLGKGLLFCDPKLESIRNPGEEIPVGMASGSRSLLLDSGLETVSTIGKYAFAGTGSSVIKFGSGLTLVGDKAFADDSSLSMIDAVECNSSIPSVVGDPFSGIDKSNVKLNVNAKFAEEWKNHSYWGQFDVTAEENGISEIPSSNGENIYITRNGNNIKVVSDVPLKNVEIFSISGIKLLEAIPDSEEFTHSLPDGVGVTIVKAVAGSSVKIAKLVE